MGLNQTKRNIILAIGITVVLGFIYYIITMRRTFVRYPGRIPYCWNDDFNLTLRQYINTAPTRNVLVITGPYQSGKSRALNVMANDLSINRHLVVNCDLSTATTPQDVISLFKIAVIKGLNDVQPYLSSFQINKASDVFKEGKVTNKEKEDTIFIEEKEKKTKDNSTPVPEPSKAETNSQPDSKSPTPSPQAQETTQANSQNNNNTKTAKIEKESFSSNYETSAKFHETALSVDPFVDYIFTAFSNILDDSLVRPYSFTKFIDYLESLKNYLRPVLFIHDFDNLRDISPPLYSSFLARVSRRPLYKDFVPIICEVKDASIHLNTNYISPSILITETTPLRDPTKDLVVKNRVFSQIELRKIMNAFGGHGGTIDRVFEDLKSGISIDNSIDKQQRAVEKFLRWKLNGSFPEPLYEICRRNGTAKIDNASQLMSLEPLFKSGHLYLSNGEVVKMAHKGVKTALCGGYI